MHSYCMPPFHLSETYTTLTFPTYHASHKYQTYPIYSPLYLSIQRPVAKKSRFSPSGGKRHIASCIFGVHCFRFLFQQKTKCQIRDILLTT